MKNSYIIFPVLFFGLMISSCRKDHSPVITPIKKSTIQINFIHHVNDEILTFDSFLYTNSLGQRYMVNDLQYFISGLAIHAEHGDWIDITDNQGIHYIDAKVDSTCHWNLSQEIPCCVYDSVRFIFGLDEASNYSNRFPDPPERDMFWPDILGGGYHYMKMNMTWKYDTMPEPLPFMFHVGIGQMYHGEVNPDSIIGFIQNYFMVKLDAPLDLTAGLNAPVNLAMNVARWFDGQNAFDFSEYPMGIMQSQKGMYFACQNGRKAFSVMNSINATNGR